VTPSSAAAVQKPKPGAVRDRRIEDPTNVWIIHPAARALLPHALRLGISANALSLAGLGLGLMASVAYFHWPDWRLATLGLLLCVGWLIADGLDGMVARATNSASAFGRIMDGLCDHGVFGLLYLAIAFSIGGWEPWVLGWAAAAAHALQSSLYESERARYHRRINGDPHPQHFPSLGNVLARLYDQVAHSLDRMAEPFDRHLAATDSAPAVAERYGARAAAPMKLLSLLSANMRVLALYIACLCSDPLLFWWIELVPMTLIAIVGIGWLRWQEGRLIAEPAQRGEGGR
jgi:phosphatidylglycerophosphate synthase